MGLHILGRGEVKNQDFSNKTFPLLIFFSPKQSGIELVSENKKGMCTKTYNLVKLSMKCPSFVFESLSRVDKNLAIFKEQKNATF